MRIEQVDFASELGRALSTRYYDELRARLTSLDHPLSPVDLVPPRGHFLVALVGDEPVGCVGLRLLDAEVAEVKHLWVDRSARRRGAGRSLLGAAEDLGRRLGACRVVLDTAAVLEEAIALYRSSGYTEIAPYNGNPHAQLFFGKDLAREPPIRPAEDRHPEPRP